MMQSLTTAALFLLLLLLVVILGLFVRAVVMRELKQKDLLIQDLREDNRFLMSENTGLLNRLMSQDLQAFATMTALTNSQSSSGFNDEYVSQSDEAVLSRMSQGGLGTPLYDDVTEPDEDLNMLLQAGGYIMSETQDGG